MRYFDLKKFSSNVSCLGRAMLIISIIFSQCIGNAFASIDLNSAPSLNRKDIDLKIGSSTAEENKESYLPVFYSKFVEGLTKIEKKYDYQHYKVFKFFMDKKPPKENAPIEEHQQFITENLNQYELMLRRISRSTENQLKQMLRAWSKVPISSIYLSFLGFNPALISQMYSYDKKLRANGHGGFIVNPLELKKIAQFLRLNTTQGGMPLSYFAPPEYWKGLMPLMNNVDSLMERLLIRYGLSIYDGALWQIGLTISGRQRDISAIHEYTERLISGSSGRLDTIRAHGPIFKYGDSKVEVNKNHGFFFRIIADEYLQQDPLYEDANVANFPNFQTPHHEDWKPITGEQAWAAIIGPLQVAHFRYEGKIPIFSDEVKLALSILPTIEYMQSDIGAIYHAPGGTHGKNPRDISNENNFSMYAALNMLYQVVVDQDPVVASRIFKVTKAQERYFRDYAFDKERKVFDQGGYYVNGRFIPTKIFATDCQTWGILALGPKWIDENFGQGTAYQIWQNTKKRSGFVNRYGEFEGIGFTDGHRILSVEWTCGGILAAKRLAEAYKKSHPTWSRSCQRDILSMRDGMERYKIELLEGTMSYLYSNKRFFIPFGWWANPIPCIASSAWILIIDMGFNPFTLGGGDDYSGTSIYEGLSPEERMKRRPRLTESDLSSNEKSPTLYELYSKQAKAEKAGVALPVEELGSSRALSDAEREAMLKKLRALKSSGFDYSLLYQWLLEILFKQPSFTLGFTSGANVYDWVERRQESDLAKAKIEYASKPVIKQVTPRALLKKEIRVPLTMQADPSIHRMTPMTPRLFQNEVEEASREEENT